MIWYFIVLKNYANFNGRASLKEYWFFVLFNILFTTVTVVLDNILGTTIKGRYYGLFFYLYLVPLCIPSLAVSVRRLHDISKSGWFYLLVLLPLIGPLWILILTCTSGVNGENKYGVNPKESNSIKNKNLLGDYISIYSMEYVILPIVILYFFISKIHYSLLPKLIEGVGMTNWYNEIAAFLIIISAYVPLCLTFSIKRKLTKLTLHIFSVLYLLYVSYDVYIRFLK